MGGANDAYVRSVSFSHDGRHIATVSDDRFETPLLSASRWPTVV